MRVKVYCRRNKLAKCNSYHCVVNTNFNSKSVDNFWLQFNKTFIVEFTVEATALRFKTILIIFKK